MTNNSKKRFVSDYVAIGIELSFATLGVVITALGLTSHDYRVVEFSYLIAIAASVEIVYFAFKVFKRVRNVRAKSQNKD